jgi:hypothetical protein
MRTLITSVAGLLFMGCGNAAAPDAGGNDEGVRVDAGALPLGDAGLAVDEGASAPPDRGDALAEEDAGVEADVPRRTTTADLLDDFFASHGGREAFAEPAASAIDALLLSEDDVDAGDYASAAARVQALFAAWPHDSDGWFVRTPDGLNVGSPVAYYGLRMLEHIVAAGVLAPTGTLQMTAIVATCATVTRPTLPDLAPETVELALDPEILADDARVLRESTGLFRHWVTAITGGLTVELVVVPMTGCATVTYTDDGSTIVSYPDAGQMVASIPAVTARDADFLWVVAPSGVPGDGSGYGRHFITGGMGGVGARPLFLSDDGWFVRKPEHLGTGRYTAIERRVYQPQWFQHEFMHHLFRTWPELGLEVTGHQWFDRATWPDDFEGRFEPDYYSEAITKRLLSATPSLAEALQGKDYADMSVTPLAAIAGDFRRDPVENDWHLVTVTVVGDEATWTNRAGVSWTLVVRDDSLYLAPDSPYGEQRMDVELDAGGDVAGLWFGGERYGRVP